MRREEGEVLTARSHPYLSLQAMCWEGAVKNCTQRSNGTRVVNGAYQHHSTNDFSSAFGNFLGSLLGGTVLACDFPVTAICDGGSFPGNVDGRLKIQQAMS